MHVGYSAIFQNPDDQLSDYEVYSNELRLAEMAEPLGFDSVWSVEHHFTDYTMCPDVAQFLSYMAGKTTRVKLGSMVMVLPWHDPMRVAEQVSMLDNMSDGRMVLGVGRGLGRVEFDGFRVDMNTSRQRFVECAEMLLQGLEDGHCEYDGDFIKQPKRAIRPAPFKTFRGRTYAAAVSPESSRIMAKLGVGLLIVPQKPWDTVVEELKTYTEIYREENGCEPPPPLVAGWTYVDENADRAEEMALKYIKKYYYTVMKHYEFIKGHLKTTKGYEYYGSLTNYIDKRGEDTAATDFAGLHPWGTPEQVFNKIVDIHNLVGHNGYMAILSFSGMPWADAERNMKLFASEVMPELKKLGIDPPMFDQASATHAAA
ncbi:MAG: LLM class flavin-dependent oxidoreductase [Gammaproteobacteria bacterium]|nr:LLM class flavin-dependent oxidoreductase [Gammaproteobacteria bacterium]